MVDGVCSVDDRSRELPPWPVPRPSRREEFAAEATGAKTDETTARIGARSGVRSGDIPGRRRPPRHVPDDSERHRGNPRGLLQDGVGRVLRRRVCRNVWEWTSDDYSPRGTGSRQNESPCCTLPRNPRVDTPQESYDLGQPGAHIPRRVIKGGSHLCSPTYRQRYRPAARQPQSIDTSTSHVGFRCIRR